MRVAVIGCGAWGGNLVRTCAELSVLGAVVDTDPAIAARQALAWGVPALALDQALDDSSLGAVLVATPAPTHAAVCRRALDHGKDVFVEKPLAFDLAEAEGLAAEVGRSDRVFMIGHLLRYHPAFEALLAIVERGEIGAVRQISASRLNLGRVRTQENAFLSLSPHDVSMILAVAGDEPDQVTATGRAFITSGVVDAAHVDLTFASGLHAHVAASWIHPFKEQKLVVIGETGALVFDDLRAWPEKLSRRDQRVTLCPDGPAIVGEAAGFVELAAEPPLFREIRHFLECCEARTLPITGIAEAMRVQRVLHRAQFILTRKAKLNF